MIFPLGVTPVTFSATDAAGNGAQAVATVTVVDDSDGISSAVDGQFVSDEFTDESLIFSDNFTDQHRLPAGTTFGTILDRGGLDVTVKELDTMTRITEVAEGHQANANSFFSALSADGRYVAFDSAATNLVEGDTNDEIDVFVHDRLSGTTTRVSVASDGTQGSSFSLTPALSADGRYVAFASIAGNLVAGASLGGGKNLCA